MTHFLREPLCPSWLECLRFDHFAAANARGAYAHTLGGGAHAGVNWTQIHVPAPLGDVMGVADAVSRLRLFAADITLLCHDGDTSFQELLMKLLFYRILAVADNSRTSTRAS
jgi:hypothetical protein